MPDKTDYEANILFEAVGCDIKCANKFLFLKREAHKSYPNRWGLPGGKIEDQETSIKAAIRELFEETHILLSSEQLSLFATYQFANADMNFVYTVFFYEYDKKPHVIIDSEAHTAFAWLSIEEALCLPLIPDLAGILKQ